MNHGASYFNCGGLELCFGLAKPTEDWVVLVERILNEQPNLFQRFTVIRNRVQSNQQ